MYPAAGYRELPLAYAKVLFAMLDFKGTSKYRAIVLAGNLEKSTTPGASPGYADAL
jgi:hypothetical protein